MKKNNIKLLMIKALTFHRIVRKKIIMQEDVLEKNLHFVLKTIGANCISMSDLASQRIKNENWLLTFDDGYVSDYKIVLPLLVKFNAKALFFIITSKIGSQNT